MYTFSKSERLCSRKVIGRLFTEGKSISVSPFRIVWVESGTVGFEPARLAISVPRRLFKRAVDRNRVKRQIRESYRKNKKQLYDYLTIKNRQFDMMIIVTNPSPGDYSHINERLTKLLDKLIQFNESAEKSC